MGGASAGLGSGVGAGPMTGPGAGGANRLLLRRRKIPAATATAPTPSRAKAGGDSSTARNELGVATSSKRTAESTVALWTFVHVAELAVVLLGAGVPDGTMTFTEYVAFEPPTSVTFTAG